MPSVELILVLLGHVWGYRLKPIQLYWILWLPTAVLGQVVPSPLSYPSLNSFSLLPSSPPLLFSSPASNDQVSISIALCTGSIPYPRFFISNSSVGGTVMGPSEPNASEISLDSGVGGWTGTMRAGGTVSVWVASGGEKNTASWIFEIGLQQSSELAHAMHPNPPYLGDTTSNLAIVFSPPFSRSLRLQQSYPNYSIPTTVPSEEVPTFVPDSSLIILNQTMSLTTFPLFKSTCALRQQLQQQQKAEYNVTSSIALRNQRIGWSSEFIIRNLTPATNYTIYLTQGPKLSGPLHILTKSSDFPCTMAHSLPYCPAVSYPIPLAPPSPGSIYDFTNLPNSISSSILASLDNFSRTLLTFPCGRDLYSPLKTCADCFDAYQEWVCAISIPRCAEPSVQETSIQLPLITREEGSNPRSTGFPKFATSYNELLPCIETCSAVVRSCPPFLGWQCPSPKTNAAQSYGIGFIDSLDGLREHGGVTGLATDRWGNMWCNGV